MFSKMIKIPLFILIVLALIFLMMFVALCVNSGNPQSGENLVTENAAKEIPNNAGN